MIAPPPWRFAKMTSQPLPTAQQGAQRFEEGWLEEAFASVERRGASGRAASGGQRRGRVVEPVRERLDQKGQEKMGQNPWLC